MMDDGYLYNIDFPDDGIFTCVYNFNSKNRSRVPLEATIILALSNPQFTTSDMEILYLLVTKPLLSRSSLP